MKLPPFEYRRAESLGDALGALAELGDDAKVLAGGQSLLPLMALRLARPTAVVDINRVDDLHGIDAHEDDMVVGCATTQATLEDSEVVQRSQPLLGRAVRRIGHRPIRARGTLGGSLAHADPAAELPLAAVVLGARIEVASPRGVRTVAADDFFRSFLETDVAPDEIAVRVHFPVAGAATGSAFTELARRHGDFAMASAAATVTLTPDGTIVSARLGLGGVDQRPVRLPQMESALVGTTAGRDGQAASVLADLPDLIDPPDDVHATGVYRRSVATTLAVRAIEQAVEDATTRGAVAR